MLVTPRPGTNRENLYQTLESVQTDVFNLQGGGGAIGAVDRLVAYLDWVSVAVARLGNQISSADLDRLVLTQRYEQLLSMAGALVGPSAERTVNGLLNLELCERVDAFKEANKTFGRQLMLWQQRGRAVVADSSIYIKHDQKLEETDFAELLNYHGGSIHLVVPMVVVDELDRLKESKDRKVRWRAGYTLAVLDRLFQENAEQATLREADAKDAETDDSRRGEVTVEVLFDSPGHVRLSINDDEIVDRAASIGPFAGHQVTLLTYDTGQSMRARAAGLKAIKLTKEIEEEPE